MHDRDLLSSKTKTVTLHGRDPLSLLSGSSLDTQQPSRICQQTGRTRAPEFRKGLCCAWPSPSSRQRWWPTRAHRGWTRSRYECPESRAKIMMAAGLPRRWEMIERESCHQQREEKGSCNSICYVTVATFYKLSTRETRCLWGKPVLLEPGKWGFIPGSTTLERVTVPLVASVSSSVKQGS